MSSLEQVAAGLFNFNPVQGLQAGTSMGAQMMQIALQSQQQQLDAGAKWDQAMLSADRNALARRTQMFNEMTTNLNRFDEQARQKSAEAWATGVGGGGGSSGGGSSVMYPQSEASPMPQSQPSPPQNFAQAPPTGFNEAPQQAVSEPAPAPAPMPIKTNQLPDDAAYRPQPIGSGGGVVADQTSFSGAEKIQPTAKIVSSASGAPSFMRDPGFATNPMTTDGVPTQMGQSPTAIQQSSAPYYRNQAQRQSLGQNAPSAPNERNIRLGQAPASTLNLEGLPNYLESDANNRVAPQQLYGFMARKIADSKLNGFVPRDGEQFGIKTGSPDEWARFAVGLAEFESGFKNTTVGDVGRFPGNSNGLFQLSPNDAQNYGLRNSPFIMSELQDGTANATAAAAIMEKLVTEDGVIAGKKDGGGWAGASRYWGPLRRGVNPLNAKAVSGLQPLAAEGAPVAQSGPSKVDGGLFPSALQPDGGQSQAAGQTPTQLYGPQAGSQEQGANDFSNIPEYRAANEARTAYQQTLSEKMRNATKMAELRTQLMQVDQEMLAKDGQASAYGLRQTDPLYKVAINPLRMQRSKIENEILGIQSQNQQVLEREKILEKSAKDADAAWKIVQDRQRAFQRAAPDAAASASPDVIFDRYVDADPRTRMKMKASFVNDKEMMARLNVADDFLKSQGGTEAAQTWEIGGTQYTLNDLAKFYTPINENSLSKPNDVQTLVESNPKLKAEVMAIQGQSQPQETAPPSGPSSGDPIMDEINNIRF